MYPASATTAIGHPVGSISPDAKPVATAMSWLPTRGTTAGPRRQAIDLTRACARSAAWQGCAAGQDRLPIVPLDPQATFHRLVEAGPATTSRAVVDGPGSLPFKIANGDRRVSLNGRFAVFVEGRDRDLWPLELAPLS